MADCGRSRFHPKSKVRDRLDASQARSGPHEWTCREADGRRSHEAKTVRHRRLLRRRPEPDEAIAVLAAWINYRQGTARDNVTWCGHCVIHVMTALNELPDEAKLDFCQELSKFIRRQQRALAAASGE